VRRHFVAAFRKRLFFSGFFTASRIRLVVSVRSIAT